MAAEVPVCDVLCEAMEYLSKLGSNLRTRSENLREKKIRKDKLRNTHAVQKAANKVLLICQLSKKSLENVETGVRKVLSIVDAAQVSTSVGGKSSSSQSKKKPDYHYFKYRSQKLRIKNRVPLRHYTSVKVLARKMSISMQKEYPVYYGCRLYWMRKKKESMESGTKHSSTEKNIPLKSDNSDQETECRISTAIPNQDSEDAVLCLSGSPEVDSMNLEQQKKSDDEENPAKECQSNDEMKKKKENSYSEHTSYTKQKGLIEKSKKCETISSTIDRTHSECSKSKKDRRKFKHIRIIESSESDAEEMKKTNAEGSKYSPITEHKIVERDKSSSPLDNISKRRKLSESDCVQSNEKQEVVSLDHEINLNANKILEKNDLESLPNKPMIKCVNINKLLKPDILLNNGAKVTNDGKQSAIKHKEKLNDVLKNEKITAEIKHEQKKQEDYYWTQKRKEVKSFKPKNFHIVLHRLPTLSVSYLQTHNLKKITHNDSVICQEINETVNKSDNFGNSKTKTNKTKKKHSENISKNVLLYNSDSDDNSGNCDDYLTVEAKKVKDSLLNESDSDHQNHSVEKDLESNIKSSLTEESEQVKGSLLNESNSNHQENCTDNHNLNVTKNSSANVKSKKFTNKANKVNDSFRNQSDCQRCSEEKDSEQNIQSISTEEVEKVKDALLNESDSGQENDQSSNSVEKDSESNDKSKNFINKAKKVIYSDPNECLSDKQEQNSVENDSLSNNEPNLTIETETLIDSGANELDYCHQENSVNNHIPKSVKNKTESNVKVNSLTVETEIVKDALLNESDSDQQENAARANPDSSKSSPINTKKNRLLYEESSDNYSDKSVNNSEVDEVKDSNSSNNMEKGGDIAKKNVQENISDAKSESNEKRTETSDKEVSPSNNPDKIKSSLLNDSSDDIPKTPLSKRKKRKFCVTPQSKRKHIMESMHAKKMLLTYSSSSDTDDEQLRNALKDIKKALLKGISDEENKLMELNSSHHCENSQVSDSSSSAAEDLINRVKKNMTRDSKPNSPQTIKKSKETTDDESDSNSETKRSKKLIDENMDDESNSSSSKVRSSN